MKKTLIILASVIAVNTSLVAMNQGTKITQHMTLIQDIQLLQPYFNAIEKIGINFRSTINNIDEKNDLDYVAWDYLGFEGGRTPKYLFLETKIEQDTEVLNRLLSPFGEINLLENSNLCPKKKISITTDFLANMDWKIEDVTAKIKIYRYTQSENSAVELSSFIPKYKARYKVYLITAVGQWSLEQPKDDFFSFFTSSFLTKEQEALDVNHLYQLSNGRIKYEKINFLPIEEPMLNT